MGLDYSKIKEELKLKGLDFDLMPSVQPYPIEEKILPLVLVLNHCRISTMASCEGHTKERWIEQHRKYRPKDLDVTEYSYGHTWQPKGFRRGPIIRYAPYVLLNTSQFPSQLAGWVRQYNQCNPTRWRIRRQYASKFSAAARRYLVEASATRPLEELQESIPVLAEFLYKEYEKIV